VTPEADHTEAQTIVFSEPPANIYMSFADGPGFYRLDVLDVARRHVRTLFEKKVVARQEEWVEWDGKDDSGHEAAPGGYKVVFSKDGKPINEIIAVRAETHESELRK